VSDGTGLGGNGVPGGAVVADCSAWAVGNEFGGGR
jgi:hypothetical protein